LGVIETDSKTWTHNVNFMVSNPELFELPSGDVGVAALVQVGRQSWSNPTDPRVIEGDFWGITGTQGAGKRDNWAGAVEFRVPILESLAANVSGRYDDYQNVDAGSDSKFTYKVGLEFRPVESLLVRGNFATAFRAPDMAYVFAGESGFFTSVVDYYRCEEAGQPVDDCVYNGTQIEGARSGNPDLKSITADSYGFGFVWSPNEWFDLRADYYDVNIDDKVSDLSIDLLLRDENECRQGRLDINSPTCIDALARIERLGPDAFQPNLLVGVEIAPINVSREQVSGILAGTTFRWGGERAGDFELALSYNRTLDHKSRQYPEDPVIDLLEDGFYSSEFPDILSADLIWHVGRWTTAVHGVRYGATPNYAEQLGLASNNEVDAGSIDPHYLFNLNVDFQVTGTSNLALTVNNLLDEGPPRDRSWTAYPYFNIFNYNGYGRAYWLQYRMDFSGAM
jgi:outer membrane receptor protein involved in Fe transport